MLQTVKTTILGMKKFVGNIDGKNIDTTKIFVKVDLDDRSGNAKGFCTQELPAGTSAVYDRFQALTFPAEFEIDMAFVSNGKAMKQNVVDLRPIK